MVCLDHALLSSSLTIAILTNYSIPIISEKGALHKHKGIHIAWNTYIDRV